MTSRLATMFSFLQIKAKLAALDEPDAGPALTTLPCTLDNSTQALVKLIFNPDMFVNALKSLEIGKVWKLLTCPLAVHSFWRWNLLPPSLQLPSTLRSGQILYKFMCCICQLFYFLRYQENASGKTEQNSNSQRSGGMSWCYFVTSLITWYHFCVMWSWL